MRYHTYSVLLRAWFHQEGLRIFPFAPLEGLSETSRRGQRTSYSVDHGAGSLASCRHGFRAATRKEGGTSSALGSAPSDKHPTFCLIRTLYIYLYVYMVRFTYLNYCTAVCTLCVSITAVWYANIRSIPRTYIFIVHVLMYWNIISAVRTGYVVCVVLLYHFVYSLWFATLMTMMEDSAASCFLYLVSCSSTVRKNLKLLTA